jgi:hypothetical protein
MRYSLVKVLLTVSPFRPFHPPEPRVFSRRPELLNSLSIYSCQLFVAAKKPNSFAIKQIQTLCTKHPGWGIPLRQLRVLCVSALSLLVDSLILCFHGVTNPFFRNSFIFTSMQNPRGVALLEWQMHPRAAKFLECAFTPNHALTPLPAVFTQDDRVGRVSG